MDNKKFTRENIDCSAKTRLVIMLVVQGTWIEPEKGYKGSVVAAEWDVAGIRLLATEPQKKTVLPVLLAGEEAESFPPLLRGRVYGDFRKDESYLLSAFDLLLSIYELATNHSAVADLRESLRGPGGR